MNTASVIPPERARAWKSGRFSPLPYLTPESLLRHLSAFQTGHLREIANIWEDLEMRDDMLRIVTAKRKKSVARHGWTVLEEPNLSPAERAEARQHAAALRYFYTHLRCEHALESSEQGGFKLLARQMMDAVGKKFAVHEIVWRPEEDAGGLSATFRFVPLSFFENTTGKLRFLEKENSREGRELEPGAWMVTAGDGLMVASSIAWMFKNLTLNDWLFFSQRHGTPALRGITSALRNSPEWEAMIRAVEGVRAGGSVVHSTADDIKVMDLAGRGSIPFPELVERMDRMLAALWRGADLSTLSRDRGYGASLQEKETCALEEDDAEMLTETLNRSVDEWVIRYLFGEKTRPLARVRVLISPRECTSADIQVDEFLLRHGAPLSLEATLHRYGRTLPKPGEAVLIRSVQASLPASSQNMGVAEGMENQGPGNGNSVSSRGGLPAVQDLANSGPGVLLAGAGAPLPGLVPSPEAEPSHSPPLPNQFQFLQEDWLHLSPYGDFPHPRGTQRITHASAQEMVRHFRSFLGRAGRLFGGVPFYVGHPDLPNSHELADRKAYGWVEDLEAREDGLYGKVKWSPAGVELLRNGHFKFISPCWEAKEMGKEKGQPVYTPIRLISVGLTNTPNLPLRALVNETDVARQGDPSGNTDVEEAGSPELSEGLRLPNNLHTVSLTENLGQRKGELVPGITGAERIQELVSRKMQLGFSYDQAWDLVKREQGGFF